MKSKKMLALALVAAIAISAASTTAFARGGYSSIEDVPGYTAESDSIVFRCQYYDASGDLHDASYTYKADVSSWSGPGKGSLLSSGYRFDPANLGLPAQSKDYYTFDGWARSTEPDTVITYSTGPGGTGGLNDDDYGCTLVPVFSQTDEQKAAEAANLAEIAESLANRAKDTADEAKAAAEAATDKAGADEAKAKLDEASDIKAAAESALAAAKEKDASVDASAADTAISGAGDAIDAAKTAVDTAVAKYSTSSDAPTAKIGNEDLVIESTNLTEEEKTKLKEAGGSTDGALVYEIHRSDSSTAGGTVKAHIPALKSKKWTLYHFHGDAVKKIGDVQADANGDTTPFDVEGFSKFVFVPASTTSTDASASSSSSSSGSSSSSSWSSGSSSSYTYNTPDTGDFSPLPLAMVAVAALGATGGVVYRKRKSAAE